MTGKGACGPTSVYVGIGVGVYDDEAFGKLGHAVPDAEELGKLLAERGYRVDVVADPTDGQARDRLRNLMPGDLLAAGGALVVMWAGHSEPSSEGGLHLVTTNSHRVEASRMSAETLAGIAARTGASQILIILDTCYSGTETISATVVADLVIKARPPEASRVWVGVLASAPDYEKARDGVFGARLRKLLRDGPTSPEQQLRWSSHSVGVRGDDVCDALVKEWDTREEQQPTWTSYGDPGVMFPNPRYAPGAPEKIVEHLLLAARGVEPGGEGFYFSGRVPQLDRIVRWMATETPGVFLITGPAGCGKSAILGRLVNLSNPEQRSRILAAGCLAHSDPGEGSVAAYVHARGLAADQLVGSLDDQLVGRGILDPGPTGRRNCGELQGALEGSGTCPVIAVDGLNELGADSWEIAEQVLRVLGAVARVIVTTRELRPSDDGPSLIETLLPDQILDLGGAEYAEETDQAISEYVARRLTGVDTHMDPAKVANAILALSQPQKDGAFLLARVLTTQLRDEPIDTSAVRWQDALSDSVEAAFDRDLGRIPALAKGDRLLPEAARELLAALSWAYGSGMPDDVWSIAATALSPAQTGYDRSDVYWLLGQVGRYIVEDGEGGRAVYRLSHQLFAEDLRRTAAGPSQTAEQHSAALAASLGNYYQKLLEAGRRADEPAYLWRYMWRHCADGGDAGIAVLRTLADMDRSAFLPDLAAASDALGSRRARSGQLMTAVASAEEAVALWRELAAANPAFTPDLAGALNNLGIRYSQVGRRGEAIAPAEEAVARYRELAAANPAFTPDLPGALNNLGNRYSEAEREDETDRIWHEVLHEFQSQPDREVPLLLARASSRPPPDLTQAIDDVLKGLSAAGNDGPLQFQCRDLLRSLRARSPADFDAAWAAADQAQPTWLLLDQATADLIYAWFATPTWRASLDFARNHLDALLAPLARLALDEIALLGDEALIATHRAILDAIGENGVDAAYEPFILPEIIGEWMAAPDWASSQKLFDANRGQLCGDRSLTLITERAADDPDALRHLAIVQAARSREDPYRLIGNPEGIRHALDKARDEGDCKRLEAIGLLGATTLDENNDRASALFHLAIGQALDPDHTVDTAISAAAKLAPDKVTSWLRLLVELAARHPDRSGQLTQLATALTPASQE